MKKQHKIQLGPTPPLPQNPYDYFPQFLPPNPYTPYQPFWKFPFYPFPDYLDYSKFAVNRCLNCRPISINSVMTQTHEAQEPHHYQSQILSSASSVRPILSQRVRFHSQQNNIRQKMCIKLQIPSQEQLVKQASHKQQENDQNSEAIGGKKEQFSNNIRQINNSNESQVLSTMLNLFAISPQAYQTFFNSATQNNSLHTKILQYFNQKLYQFKKSKQQMIKLIIRKTQRYYKNEYNCKKDERFVKFGGYKSMNSVYLQKLFSDPKFVRCYNIISVRFIEEFEKQNKDKLDMYLQKVNSSRNTSQFQIALKSLDQKNKMPWPLLWIQKLRRVLSELKITYSNNSLPESISEKSKKKRSK